MSARYPRPVPVVTFWLGLALLIVTSAVMFLTREIGDVTAVLLIFGVIITLTSYFRYIGVDRDARDERARKLGSMAATLSWYGSLMFIGLLAVFGYWGGRQYSNAELFGIVIFLMAGSMAVSMIYYRLKGDVE